MNKLERIKKYRKLGKVSWDKLAEGLPIEGNSLRVAFSRDSVQSEYIEIIERNLNGTGYHSGDSNGSLLTNTNGNKYHDLKDGTYKLIVELIPFSAYASYIEYIGDNDTHTDFDEVEFIVDHFGKGNYKAFNIKGESMFNGGYYDVKEGDIVLGRELQRHHWKDGFVSNDLGWLILHKANIFHKDITAFNSETGEITCSSRNPSPEYSDFKVNLDDVYQIFKVIKKQS